MANKMLIDATHPEETRVVVLRGNRVEEFDFESAHRKQLRGNIYLAKVTRVEPSLQAAFVDYGGNRHGFLAFSEIHPDYYQIPVADRQALIDEEERAERAADDEVDRRVRRHRHRDRPARRDDEVLHGAATEPAAGDGGDSTAADAAGEETPERESGELAPQSAEAEASDSSESADEARHETAEEAAPDLAELAAPSPSIVEDEAPEATASSEDHSDTPEVANGEPGGETSDTAAHDSVEDVHGAAGEEAAEEIVESVGGADAMEEVPDRAPRYRRQYKIQEVIKRRQVMLVQVVKEERGTKGAALTTYLSLAGRYSVLMPNTARGGGISRKITSAEDRARLKEAAADLEVPEGMGVILRTAGANRTKMEIKRDFEYLLRLWETVRDLTLKSTAPKLVYEEGSLVKRSIRDLYGKEIDEIIVAGSEGYREAKDFMRMLMPSHAKNVKPYSDTQPLLSRYAVESQLDAMFSPVVQLRSGGYIVINQAEALVAIDVNSGRATREHHIEDTALKTNLEASDEIARQLRLRDLAGLIVIDFIDMDENRNNRAVERRMKECLRRDRARIQVGRISHFGLLEMSRQRIRTSVLESSTEKCPYCGGSGHVRSVSSLALQVLRALEEQLMRDAMHNLTARTRRDVALYVLNHKRAHLRALEERFAITITVLADETVTAPQAFVIDRGEQVHTVEAARALAEQNQALAAAAPLEEEDDLEDESSVDQVEEQVEEPVEAEAAVVPADEQPEQHDGEGEPRRRRRRRGRGGRDRGRSEQFGQEPHQESHHEPLHEQHIPIHQDGDEPAGEHAGVEAMAGDDAAEAQGETAPASSSEREERPEYHGERPEQQGGRRRRRGRRGGRRNRHDRNGDGAPGYDDRSQAPQQHGFAPGEEASPPPPVEAELGSPAADLDTAPMPVAASPSPPEPETRRRRSTVREPAPVRGGETAAPVVPTPPAPPASEPVVNDAKETADANQPRKTGWWSRRFAGG
jgi:ribonuclease E